MVWELCQFFIIQSYWRGKRFSCHLSIFWPVVNIQKCSTRHDMKESMWLYYLFLLFHLFINFSVQQFYFFKDELNKIWDCHLLKVLNFCYFLDVMGEKFVWGNFWVLWIKLEITTKYCKFKEKLHGGSNKDNFFW